MWSKLREKIQSIFGLTQSELSFILLLASLTAVGFIFNLVKDWNRPKPEIVFQSFTKDSVAIDTIQWRKNADRLVTLLNETPSRESADSLIEALHDQPVNIVNINKDDAKTIASLPGIGFKVAQRIVDYRTQNGAFGKIEDIQRVKGIGKKVFDKIKAFIEI